MSRDSKMSPKRRHLLALLASPYALSARRIHAGEVRDEESRIAPSAARKTKYAQVVPGHGLRFPEDHGSHPSFRTEWWYITGWLDRARGSSIGFQVTFFRARPDLDTANPSAFTPRQIVIAHAALSDARRRSLLHDQKIARAALELAGAEEGRTRVWIDDWSLAQDGSSYRAQIRAHDFSFDFEFEQTQPPLLQGDSGYSRKGPRPDAASYYYSVPHLRVSGVVAASGELQHVTGSAWLDHEWSSTYMDDRASGWDWVGVNMDDGSAFMAFQMRERDGKKFWAGGALRTAAGQQHVFAPEDVDFMPLRTWRSPRTGAVYPVSWRVRAGGIDITLEPLMDDQESDTRMSVGAVYWEGAVHVSSEKKPVGRGYLELTGYVRPMRL